MSKYNFKDYLESQGYSFDEELLENFLLSLKAKPFIVLLENENEKLGPSQLFAEYLVNHPKEYYMIKVSTLKRSHDGGNQNKVGWGIFKEYLDNILPIDKINKKKYEVEIGGISVQEADISLNVQLYYDYDADGIKNYFKKLHVKEKLKKSKDKEAQRKHEQQMVYLGISYDSILNIISDNYINSDEIILYPTLKEAAVKGKQKSIPFELFKYMPFNQQKTPCNIIVNGMIANADIELKLRMRNYSTGEIRKYLNNLYEHDETHFELKLRGFEHNFEEFKSFILNSHHYGKYEVISMDGKSEDNSHILGFYDEDTMKYHSTPACEIIKQAQSDPNHPYFLILNGMNGGHVEHFLKDILFAMETGKEVLLYEDKTLKFPKNLFIIVTSHSDKENNYLPKFLDKANVIELDALFNSDLISKSNNRFNHSDIYLEYPLLDSDISLFKVDDFREILSDIFSERETIWDLLSSELSKFEKILMKYDFDFNYWVIEEILRFMIVSWKYEEFPREWMNWERYFDAQIKQKVLPKIEGNNEIKSLLINLFNLCLKDGEQNISISSDISDNNCKYYTSALKLQRMYHILLENGYVSFISTV